ncbi:MAG: hypothetical protein LBP75_08710 [Planctomycetota bacterium]|nr:hypothetical protein [Planctomycetota bacterium]
MGMFDFMSKKKPAEVAPAGERKVSSATVRRAAPAAAGSKSQRLQDARQLVHARRLPSKAVAPAAAAPAAADAGARKIRAANPGKYLGQLLIKNGKLTEPVLNQALAEQKESGLPLGQILRKKGWAEQDDIAAALKQQHIVTTINLNTLEPDPQALALLEQAVCEEHRLVPFELFGNQLCLAMSNVLDAVAKNDVRTKTNCQLKTFDASVVDIKNAIARWYGEGSPVEVVEEIIEAPTANLASKPASAPVKPSSVVVHETPADDEPIPFEVQVEPLTEVATPTGGGMMSLDKDALMRRLSMADAIPVSARYAESIQQDNTVSPEKRWLAALTDGLSIPALRLPEAG